MKENDYLLNMLSNPDFDESDFREVGLTTDNTSLENRDVYKNIDAIRENPLMQTDGEFDEAKFDQVYNAVLQSYNNFAAGITTERIADEHKFYRNDIYADYESRNHNVEASIHREANPLRKGKGLIHANDVMDSPFSVREIAQTQKVWDEATQSWQDAPNESFFDNFFETRVLAQYDEDGEHEDPFTGQMVKHKKGDKKINENGTFYYENLNGRDIYGREVLSKFDTLTVDGTFVNKFDFFDSDDKDKSVVGSLVKNAVKVIPAFIPYVSPIYLGARVGLNTIDLVSKLGKVFTGSDSPTLSALEGFTKSLAFSTSDYSQGSTEAETPAHAWSMENLLNMGADTFTQLAEQRWIFNFAPAILKGRAGIQNKWGQEAAKKMQTEAWEKTGAKSLNARIKAIQESGKNYAESAKSWAQLTGDLQYVSKEVGEEALSKYMKDYHELGKVISQAYMTGVTVGDAYGEAKQEGATDMEAALLTIGYAIGEYKILNSDLGQWILPELKADKRRFREVAKKLKDIPQPDKSATVSEKMNWISKVVDWGKKSAQKIYNSETSGLLPSIGAGAVAEGVEEVSEELLYDVSKSLFNVVSYLRGPEATRLTAFDDITNRYALSFVGGALGGAVASVEQNYRDAKTTKPLKDKDAAFQELVHIVKEGKAGDFLSTVNKMTWDSKDLSAIESEDVYGNKVYMPGTSKDNQDKAIKDAMKQQVAIIQNILDANGALIDDESILGILTNSQKDIRYRALQQSTFAASYLQEFNDISTRIVDLVKKINDLNKDNATDDDKASQSNYKAELKRALEEKDAYTSGKRTGEFISKALWEMSEDVSSAYIDVNKIQWIENTEKKKIKDIAPDRLKVLEEEWNKWSAYNRKDKLEIAYRIFVKNNTDASDMLKKYNLSYFDEARNKENVISNIQNIFGSRMESYTALNNRGEYGVSDEALVEVSTNGAGDYFKSSTSVHAMAADLLANKLQTIDSIAAAAVQEKLANAYVITSAKDQESEVIEIIADLLQNEQLVNAVLADIQNVPYINYATKDALLNTFGIEPKYIEVTGGLELDPTAASNSTKITQAISKKAYSPALELINSWSLGLGNIDMSVEHLINQLQTQYNTLAPGNTLGEFSMTDDNAKRITTALSNIKLLKASILAARTDGVTGSNRVGYNVTANEVLGLDLAEIDKNNANVLLQDINKVENQLKYYERLHTINTGQKLKEHHKVSVNKDIITFNKLKKFVTENDWPPKEWIGAEELKNVFREGFEIIDTLDETGKVDDRRLVLNDYQKISLKRDVQKIDSAIHKFFEANKEKLSDPDRLSELLSENLFSFQDLDDGLLNTKTESLSDTQFVWWLATRAAMNPDDFYKAHKDNMISGIAPIPAQEQAIMTAVAGVLNGEVFSNFAKAYNKTLVKKAKQLEGTGYFEGLKPHRAFSKSDPIDSDRAIQFFRHVLIEGIAGSGKTSAVAKTIVNLLRTSDKGQELLNNVWFVHATEDQAKNWAKEIGYGDDYEHAYSREQYLEKVAPGVTKMRKFENDQLKLNKEDLIQRPEDTLWRYNTNINTGYSKNAPSMVMMDEVTGFSQQDLLLSDEFANHYGIMNLVFGDFVQDGLEGEMELDSREVDGDKVTDTLVSQVFRGNFAGSIKLGDSLRTANGVKDANNKELQAHIYEILQGETLANRVALKWYTDGTEANGYQDATTILGDKIYTDAKDIESIKADIDVLLNQIPSKEDLKDSEKLGYIYDERTKNGEIYKYLTKLNESGKHKGKILLKEGSSSQGLEADFYVIDLDFPTKKGSSKSKFYRQLYTGLTRAKKATIGLIQGSQELLDSNNNRKPEESAGEFSLGQTGIDQFSKDIKKIYDEVYTEGKQLTYKKFNNPENAKVKYTIKGTEYEQITKPDGVIYEPNDTFEYGGDTYTLRDTIQGPDGKQYVWATFNDEDYLWEINDFINNIIPKTKGSSVAPITHKQKETDESNLDKIDIKNDKESELNMLLHSFATNETGVIEERTKQRDGSYKVRYKVSDGFKDGVGDKGKAKGRVDSMNGLIKLAGVEIDSDGYFKKSDDYHKLKNVLEKVRSAALYAKKQSEILNVLVKEMKDNFGVDLNPTKNKLNTRIIFKSNDIPGKIDSDEGGWFSSHLGFSKFFKSVKERIRGLFTNDGEHVVPTQKHLSVMITQEGKDGEQNILELPILNLTNPMTIAGTQGFEDVAKVIDKVESKLKTGPADPGIVDILKETIKELEAHPVKMSKPFVKLAKLYLNVTDGKVLLMDEVLKSKYGLNDDEITLSNIFDTTGPLMTSTEKGTGVGRHAKYRDAELDYSGKWMELQKYKEDSGKVVSDILVAGSDISGIKKGHPFVLVSDAVHVFNKANNDKDLVAQYQKQLADPSEQKLVKLIYVSPPTVSVQEYFENLDSVYRKHKDVDPTIGNDLTSFNILRMMMEEKVLEDKSLMAEAFTKPGTGYDKLKTMVLKLASHQDSKTVEEFLNMLSGDSDIDGVSLSDFVKEVAGKDAKAKSWKSFMQSQLRWYTLSGIAGGKIDFNFSKINDDSLVPVRKMKAIQAMLERHNMEGIFYSPELSRDMADRNVGMFKRVVNENGKYKGRHYTINGKIDSQAYKGNVLPIIDAILDATVVPAGETMSQLEKDTTTYMNDNYSLFSKKKEDTKKTKISNMMSILESKISFNSGLSKIKSTARSFLNANPDATIDDIVQHLRDNNYFVMEESGYYVILTPSKGHKLSNDSKELNIGDGTTREFTRLYFDPSSNKWKAEFNIPEESTSSSTGSALSKMKDEYAGYILDMLGYYYDGFSGVQEDVANLGLARPSQDVLNNITLSPKDWVLTYLNIPSLRAALDQDIEMAEDPAFYTFSQIQSNLVMSSGIGEEALKYLKEYSDDLDNTDSSKLSCTITID